LKILYDLRKKTMDSTELRAMQAPLKDNYRENPDAAIITLKAKGELDEAHIACKVETGRAMVLAGLHPATGGSGAELCSGDMLLEALVACAGVTLKAVSTALEIPLRKGIVKAEGDLDFRGTLGVDKTAPVGFRSIRLSFDLDTDAPQEKIDQLIKLTERYCVIFQTLNTKPDLSVTTNRL
jgi:uncharacterized OsmC-like protein